MSRAESAEVIVVGAGVVGLAVARALAALSFEVLIIEANAGFGLATSARGSAVVHAGIYYPTGSLKARTCVRGRHLLYEYAARRGVAVRRTGKLIVACASQELAALEELKSQAQLNGVEDLRLLTRSEVQKLEPALAAHAALLSPSTGIIDGAALLRSLFEDAVACGVRALFDTQITGAHALGTGFELTREGPEHGTMRCEMLVNCAGLGSVELARNTAGLDPRGIPRAYLCKGSYFALAGPAPFRHLIYPLPEPGGLGVHLTLDMAGAARFGPDAEWIAALNFDVDPGRVTQFERAISCYWPHLPPGALRPAYAGVRPKIVGPEAPPADFRIDSASEHGITGLINLFGIESPGLTAALAIAEHVAALLM